MNCFIWLKRFCPVSANLRGWILFQIGLFLLPSSAFLSALCFLPALVIASLRRSQPYWKDPWNISFMTAGVLMISGCVGAYSDWLAWIGLANWLPFFWCFWAFQGYLCTDFARRRCALLFLAGTFPVFITGFGQLWLGWEGPWQFLNGLIIWFIAPGGEPQGRLSGLFDYANIAGAWLAVVWPFALAFLLQPFVNIRNRVFISAITISIAIALILTDSRNAWGGLILAIPFVIGPARWIWLLPLLSLTLMPVALAVLPGVGLELQQWARQVVPEGIWARLNDMYMQRSIASTRLNQWIVALGLVLERPWLGWGAAAFSVVYPLRTGQWHGHAHNLPLEVAVAHGIPVTILVIGTVLALLAVTLKRGVLTKSSPINEMCAGSIFDRAWWTASFVLVVLHASDMPFFDSRLNIAGWILLAGLRCMTLSLKSDQDVPSKILLDVQ